MFKEFGLIILIMGAAYVTLFRIRKRNSVYFLWILIGLVGLTTIINLVYNFKYIFPDYVYEGVPIGDSSENLFTYKKDSEFQWQILFPILKNREVYIDDRNDFYYTFMETYADKVIKIEIPETVRQSIAEEAEESWTDIMLSMLLQLDYIFPEYIYLPKEGFPYLKINLNNLGDSTELAAYVDEKENLYLMSKEYLDLISEGMK